MNETLPPGSLSDVPWPTSGQRVRVPDASLLPGSDTAARAADGLLKHAPQGADDTIERTADSGAPTVRQLHDSVAAAEEEMQATTAPRRDTLDAWIEGLRTHVRSRPLASVATAFALGALVAGVTR